MGAGYTRQSTFANDDVIDAGLFNAEYNQLVATFDSTSGHSHDGTVGNGPKLSSSVITFDNTASGLAATDIQAAVDELEERLDSVELVEQASDVPYDNAGSAMLATDVQGALDELDVRIDSIDAIIISGPVQSIAGQTGIVTLVDIGLGNVDNTTDLNKPVSTATQTALDLKADTTYVDAQIAEVEALALAGL